MTSYISTEIQELVVAGNRATKDSRVSKIRTYKTISISIITYESQVWSSITREKNKAKMWE